MKKIILFDGTCNFCNNSVQFIIKRDKDDVFSFASLQSNVGKAYLERFKIQDDIDSIVYIEEDRAYIKSNAALRISRHLEGMWKLASVLTVVPRFVRDPIYDYVAKNRYKWFGRNDSCHIPSPEIRKKFLD
ncbi:thiol-disulfide oxidoreductase DCC family protein [Bacillus sp. PS06]|uniref:thiol-disulfide oxidoreductase DCC family protein n=1 Tax=Bacillus sp. PS06 TaxID=2764176 RepID=UPI0017841A26|nr:thiol-disulfide oxidoreductase DCC family protein [Bacillus sp. PS06]MBD8067381.1 thiol-disulfide oxidoreductase DCC family protein [Bacillus sp. PS06]